MLNLFTEIPTVGVNSHTGLWIALIAASVTVIAVILLLGRGKKG